MKITLDQLRKNNQGYALGADALNEQDLKFVNDLIYKIESTRTKAPQSLDKVVYTTKQGEYFSSAMVEVYPYGDGKPCILQRGSAHVLLVHAQGLCYLTSGGSYDNGKNRKKFEYVGKSEHTFWTWGSGGAGAHMGLYFTAEVSLFRYNERSKKLQHLTEEFLTSLHVADRGPQTLGSDYRFIITRAGKSWKAFYSECQLRDFLQKYHAVGEPKNSCKYWILNPIEKIYFGRSGFERVPGEEIVSYWNGSNCPHKTEIVGNDHITHIDCSAEDYC